MRHQLSWAFPPMVPLKGKFLSNHLRSVCFVRKCVIKVADGLIEHILCETPLAYQVCKTQGQLSWNNTY